MTALQFVTPEQAAAATERISVILHGPEGSGKTTGACSAPDPILFVNADAASRVRFARRTHPEKDIREVRVRPRPVGGEATALTTLGNVVLYLRDHDEVETVVVDPISKVYACVLDEIGGRQPQIQHHYQAQQELERFVLALLEEDVHVVLVAYDHPYTMGTNDDGSEVRELLPFCGSSSNPALAKALMRPVDVVGYVGFMDRDKAVESGLDVGEGEERIWIAQTVHGPKARRAKEGLGVLGDYPRLDITEWVALNAAAQNGKPTKKED